MRMRHSSHQSFMSYVIRVTICLISLFSLGIMNAGCEAGDPLDSVYVTNLHATTLTQGNAADNYTARLAEIEYLVETLDNHLHNKERWYGATGGAGDDWAEQNMTAYTITSGSNTWGTATNIIGKDDTPIFTGGLRFDLHRILVTNASKDTVYRIRFIWGGGTPAQAVTADNYSSFFYIKEATAQQVVDVMTPDLPIDTKVWAECWNATNLATISLFVGLHEYNF
jgi:hypothetical protein